MVLLALQRPQGSTEVNKRVLVVGDEVHAIALTLIAL
jgi:hypothetical protein